MLLIPEMSTVLILPPRTGSGTLRRAVLSTYPQAVQIYRHMEADGIPFGYNTWNRIGIARNPFDRLWSLYKFLRGFSGEQHDPAFVRAMQASVQRPFSDWLVNNQVVFTSPYDRAGRGRFWPQYAVRHPMPENQKSQALYLRPDLGTEVVPFSQIQLLADHLGVDISQRANVTEEEPMPPLCREAVEFVQRVHAWDFNASSECTHGA